MDKKKRKAVATENLERDEQKPRTKDRKRVRKTNDAEPDSSSNSTNSEHLQKPNQAEPLTESKSEISDENVRLKVGCGTKRMKKPPKSLENFICRPAVRISQRFSHRERFGSCRQEVSSVEVARNKEPYQKTQKEQSCDGSFQKSSTSLHLPSSSRKDSATVTTPKKTHPKHTKKTDSKLILASDGPSYAVQPQTNSKVPLSGRITSATLLKQTHSPPAAPSPPLASQQNTSPQDSTRVLTVQREKAEGRPSGVTVTCPLSSQNVKDPSKKCPMPQHQSSNLEINKLHSACSATSLSAKKSRHFLKKTSKIRESNVEGPSIAIDEDQKQNEALTSTRSKESICIQALLPLPASVKSADSSVNRKSTCMTEVQECRGRNKKRNASSGDSRMCIDNDRKLPTEPGLVSLFQSKEISRTVPGIENLQNKSTQSSSKEETADFHTPNCSVVSTENCSTDEALQNVSAKKHAVLVTEMSSQDNTQSEKLGKVAQTIPTVTKIKKAFSIKSNRFSSQDEKARTVGRPPKVKAQQNRLPESLEPKKRGRPKLLKLHNMTRECRNQNLTTQLSTLDHHLKDLSSPRKESLFKNFSNAQTQSSENTASVKKYNPKTTKSISKARDTQIFRKRKRLMMKSIIKNINLMRAQKNEVCTKVFSESSQIGKADFSHKEGAQFSLSSDAQNKSSLVSCLSGKTAPQINISKRGTIYIGKRRGRKPKLQRQSSDQSSPQAFQKNQLLSDQPVWYSHGEHDHLFKSQSSVCSSPFSFKELNSSTITGGFRKKRYPSECEYDQQRVSKVKSTMPGTKSKLCTYLQSMPPSTAQYGSFRMQDGQKTHLDQTVLLDQDRLNYKCHRKGHCLNREKIRRHKHKCKRKYLQLIAKRQDPAFLAELEELVVRLKEIRIVHHATRHDMKSGNKSGKEKAHSHVLQCLPQNLHHPAMFQINLSGYYTPQSDSPRDPLHYMGTGDFKRNNRCATQPGEHIVTHCPVAHKLSFPLPASTCYHLPYKVPLSATSFGFGLYRGYSPSATIYPSSSLLPSYMHPYSKTPILSPSKFNKRKHRSLRRDSLFCDRKPEEMAAKAPSSSGWFNRNNWLRQNNKEQSRAGRLEDGAGIGKVGNKHLLVKSKLGKDHFGRRSSSNASFSNSQPLINPDKQKASFQSYVGPTHLRPLSKIHWIEHHQPWRWRGNSEFEHRGRNVNQDDGSEDEDDEELLSPPLPKRTVHHQTFLKSPISTGSTNSRMTAQRSVGDKGAIHRASSNVMKSGSSLIKDAYSPGDKRASESLHLGRSLFPTQSPLAYHFLNERHKRERKEMRHNISRTLFSSFSTQTTKTSPPGLNKPNLKHASKLFRSTIPKHQESTGSEGSRRGPGRPKKNLSAYSSPILPETPLQHKEAEHPAKQKKGEQHYTVVSKSPWRNHGATYCEKRKKNQRNNREKERTEEQTDERNDGDINQEFLLSHKVAPSPSRDSAASVSSQSKRISFVPLEKTYEWAGLYSDVYKTENSTSRSSTFSSECLEYNPEEHQHGLLPAPLHVGKYLRLKRIDFQLPHDVFWLCAQNKLSTFSNNCLQRSTTNESSDATSQTQVEESSCEHHDHDDALTYGSDRITRNVSTDDEVNDDDEKEEAEEEEEEEEDEEETNHTDSIPPNPLKQQEQGSDAENVSSPLLMMPLSCHERNFVLKHAVFLVRNYEKMREKQASLLMEGVSEQEKEIKEDRKHSQCHTEVPGDTSTKSDQCLIPQSENRFTAVKIKERSGKFIETLQEIFNAVVSHKGASGQTLAAPLLNLCSRKRSGSAPVDLSTLQKQLYSGLYDSLDTFHSDMLKVFQCAEKYYGHESSVGRNVKQLREVYHFAHQEALSQIASVL